MPRTDSEDKVLSQGQRDCFKDDKARNKVGGLLVAYHGSQAFDGFDLSRSENAG